MIFLVKSANFFFSNNEKSNFETEQCPPSSLSTLHPSSLFTKVLKSRSEIVGRNIALKYGVIRKTCNCAKVNTIRYTVCASVPIRMYTVNTNIHY